MQAYKQFMSTNLPLNSEARNAYDSDYVASFLNKLSAFDKDMVEVVERSGVLKGIPDGSLKEGMTPLEVIDLCFIISDDWDLPSDLVPCTLLSISTRSVDAVFPLYLPLFCL